MLFWRAGRKSAVASIKSRALLFSLLAPLLCSALFAISARALELEAGEQLFITGKYSEAEKAAKAAVDADNSSEDWRLLLLRSQFTLGQYTNSYATLVKALEDFPYSIRVRMTGYDIARANGEVEKAQAMLEEINQLTGRRDWAYRDAPNQLALGQAALKLGADPKRVLKVFFDPIKRLQPTNREVYLVTGQLALDKNDFKLAGKVFGEAAKKFPKDPDILFGLAQAFATGDSEVMEEALEDCLKYNTNHIAARLLIADNHVDAEEYADAEEELARVLAVNPSHPEAWAYRAVLAHLRADEAGETTARKTALKFWDRNPLVDHLIGRKLAQKYRFAEGAAYQRRALKYDPEFLPAKIQLASDLLRLGDEAEGWKLAESVSESDPYDVSAYNLITLKDVLEKFTTLTNDHFLVRMSTREASIYGDAVLGLLEKARTHLTGKYGLTLTNRVTVEIFPEQKDFAIRTFGMPGGAGFLGVCFGNVITANSPATRPQGGSSWEAILWHEFCHVVTLQLTRNKMPRWLSEGISVYEERQAGRAWGEQMSPAYRAMILGDDLTPVSELSGAFLTPKSPLHLQFAYYESSLVVEYLIEKFGLDSLKKILADLANGVEINKAISAHAAPMERIEPEFTALARDRARKFGPGLDWTKPDKKELRSEEAMAELFKNSPTNFYALTERTKKLLTDKKWTEAVALAEKLIALCPEHTEKDNGYVLLARAYRGLKDPEKERETLTRLANISSELPDAFLRLMELAAERKDWREVEANAVRFLSVNPLVPPPHRFSAMALEELHRTKPAINEWQTMLKLDAPDTAEVHYRLARLYQQTGDAQAKRHLLQALEEAPRFRDAHKLLLEMNSAGVKPTELKMKLINF